MQKLMNDLYIFSDDIYLARDGENVVMKRGGTEVARRPLHNYESIRCFSRVGASPALLGKCMEDGISVIFFTPEGRYLAEVDGMPHGNVLLRRSQYDLAGDSEKSLRIAAPMISAKLFNSRWVLERAIRDHSMRIDVGKVRAASARLRDGSAAAFCASSVSELRGIEGDGAADYFRVFENLILNNDGAFA